ncbi:MAG: ribosome maturation factor RimP [Clostridiales bacterium]|nr:ribosome maturation factor RimP [Clostridiales bacterium]
MSKITELVWQMAEPVAQRHGCTVWDVEFVKEAGERFLRVYIDSEEGVDIDQCEAVSRELDPMLDEADPIPEAYTFEVSSAGAERELKRPGDFERFMGSYVAVKLYSAKGGRKEHLGTLTGYSEDTGVEIEENGKKTVYARSEVAQVRLRIMF